MLDELEAVIDSVVRRQRRCERGARLEYPRLAALQLHRQDVRRCDEEIWPEIIALWIARDFVEIGLELVFARPPGEISVRLREAKFGEGLHHLRPGEGFRQEYHVGVPSAHLADKPLPERKRFGVGIVVAKDAYALIDPKQKDRAERHPQRDAVDVIEIRVDDVLVFLRRVFGEADRAVRA